MWWKCHRRLISDALHLHGIEVIHILGVDKLDKHKPNPDMCADENGRPVYDLGVTQTIFLVPGVVVLGLILGVYRWRVHRIPWAFLVVTTVVMLQSALIEAFGVQAGAEVGSLSNISLLAVLIYGFLRIRPVWRLGLTGITLVILGRRVIASPFLLLLLFPLTRIGTALEVAGRYMALAALVLLAVGWIWLGISLLGNRHFPAPA